jgi:hypothetical protein
VTFASDWRKHVLRKLANFWRLASAREHTTSQDMRELALKGAISRLFKPDVIPSPRFVREVYSHDLENLINLAGLRAELASEMALSDKFAANWLLVREWSEQSRYELTATEDARHLLEAIDHPNEGVFAWIRNHW